MATENSVVASLNEVRRIERERRQRSVQEAQEAQRESEEREWESQRRASGEHAAYQGGAGVEGAHNPYSSFRRTTELPPIDAAWERSQPYSAALPERRSSSAPAIILTTVLLAGAGAAGYWQLDQDFQARLRVKDMARIQAEEDRNKAVEARVRTEQETKQRVSALEARVVELTAAAAATKKASVTEASNAVPEPVTVAKTTPAKVAAPVAKARPQPTAKLLARADRPSRASLSPKSSGPAEKAASDKPVVPLKIAKPKHIVDDPLGNLKL